MLWCPPETGWIKPNPFWIHNCRCCNDFSFWSLWYQDHFLKWRICLKQKWNQMIFKKQLQNTNHKERIIEDNCQVVTLWSPSGRFYNTFNSCKIPELRISLRLLQFNILHFYNWAFHLTLPAIPFKMHPEPQGGSIFDYNHCEKPKIFLSFWNLVMN